MNGLEGNELITRMNDFLERAGAYKKRKIAVAAAQDENVLQSVNEAYKRGLTDAVLVGDKEEILRLSDKIGLDITKFDLILGIEKPKVAVLAAVETVNPSMQATVDAAALCKMVERVQIRNCLIDGPLALDIAINKTAAEHKGIKSEVAGDADILVVPDIEAGNILHKSLVFLNKAKSCAVIAGAKVPLVVTSRAEDYMAKLNSIALASIISGIS